MSNKLLTSFFSAKKSGTEKKEESSPSRKSARDSATRGHEHAEVASTGKKRVEHDEAGSVSSPKRQRVSHGIAPPSPSPASSHAPSKISSGDWHAAFEAMEPSWKSAMAPFLAGRGKEKLITFLEQEQKAGKVVYPSPRDVFSFMQACPLDAVQVVVVGQDPYHGPGQAHGMCFSVQRGVQVPPSLRNMLKEAAQDLDLEPKVRAAQASSHGNLSSWSRQGVLLLNTCLTVRNAEPLSHKNKGWEEFTDQVILLCSKRDGLVYLCWGKEAQNKCARVNTTRNLVISSSHPSPLGAYKTDAPFMGSKCFSRCNTYLNQKGKPPVNFNLD